MVKESYPKIADCLSELAPLLQLKNVSYKSMEEELDTISLKLEAVSREMKMINAYQEHPSYQKELDGLFIDRLTAFHKDSSSKISFLRQELKMLSGQVKKVLNFFGEEPGSKLTAEAVIDYLTRFLNAFEVRKYFLSSGFVSRILQAI
jgi:flagellar biosynthesis chaperone FliJ